MKRLPQERARASEGDDAILARYLEGERIRTIPKKTARKMLVLRWLVGRFEPGRDYSEREVNELIAQAHPDVATLRRELYDRYLMDRENGVYRRRQEPSHAGDP